MAIDNIVETAEAMMGKIRKLIAVYDPHEELDDKKIIDKYSLLREVADFYMSVCRSKSWIGESLDKACDTRDRLRYEVKKVADDIARQLSDVQKRAARFNYDQDFDVSDPVESSKSLSQTLRNSSTEESRKDNLNEIKESILEAYKKIEVQTGYNVLLRLARKGEIIYMGEQALKQKKPEEIAAMFPGALEKYQGKLKFTFYCIRRDTIEKMSEAGILPPASFSD